MTHGLYRPQAQAAGKGFILRPQGGTNKPIQPRHLHKEAGQPNPTRAYLDKHRM